MVKKNQEQPFGIQKTEIKTGYHNHIGDYVHISPGSQQEGASGRLDRIEEGSLAVLNPHQGLDYDSERNLFFKNMINKDLTVDLSPGTKIRPVSKEGLEASCRNQNINEGVEKEIHKSQRIK